MAERLLPDGDLIWVSLPLPGPTFGLIVNGGRVVYAPPIARWAIGKSESVVAASLRRRGAEFRRLGT